MTKKGEKLENTLEEVYNVPEAHLDGKYTKTTHFMLYGLGINPNSNVFRYNFLNAFIDDAAVDHNIKNPIFILFQTEAFNDKWKRIETILKSIPVFIYEYDVGVYKGKNLIMFAFEFPSIFGADYFKFLQGEYSKFSPEYKKLFKKEFKNEQGVSKESAIYGVINKTDSLKEKIENRIDEKLDPTKEYWEKMSPEREIFRYNQ